MSALSLKNPEITLTSFEEANAHQLVGTTWAIVKSMVMGMLFLLVFMKFMGSPVNLWIVSLFVQISLVAWVMYQKRWYVTARYFVILGSSLGCLLVLMRFGVTSYAYFTLGPLVLGILSVFQTAKERYGISLTVLALAIAIFFFEDSITVVNRVESPENYRIVFVLLTMGLYYNIAGSFLRVNRDFRLRLKGMLDRLEYKEERLQLKCLKEQSQVQEFELTNRKLEVEIQNRIDMERELSSSNEQLEQFSYAASHDLKEPLRSISGFIQLIQRKVVSVNDAEINEHTRAIALSASRMTKLFNDLLEFSRAGKLQRTSTQIDLNKVIESAAYTLKGALDACGAKVDILPLSQVIADRKNVDLVVCQLILNSIQNRDPSRPLIISISEGGVKQGMVQILVSDNGRGIDPVDREQVFQLFHRDNVSEEDIRSGIGLSICRKIIHSFGGEIKFVSSGNEYGARCLFTLPVLSAKA